MKSIEDLILFSNGDCGYPDDFEEQDYDGRRGTDKRLPLNSPEWMQHALEMGLIDEDEVPQVCRKVTIHGETQ